MSNPVFAPLRSELARAYTRFFGSRGGFTPAPFKEIMPVVVMDNEAWPGARRWSTSEAVGAAAAVDSIVQLQNIDPNEQQSLCVIDWLRIQTGTAQDIILGTSFPVGTVGFDTGPFTTPDVAPAPPLPSAGVPLLANVVHGTRQQVLSPSGYRLFGITLWESPSNWPKIALPPQSGLIICTTLVNTTLNVSMGGRYYSGL